MPRGSPSAPAVMVELFIDEARTGAGFRRFVVLSVGSKWALLFHVPTLHQIKVDRATFDSRARATDFNAATVAKIIRRNLATYERLKFQHSPRVAKLALSAIRAGRCHMHQRRREFGATRPCFFNPTHRKRSCRRTATEMKKSQAFKTRFYKSEDVKDGPITVTIDRMYQDRIGADKEEKNILAFTDTERELVLNATCWDLITEITGSDDSDDWRGQQIVLFHTRVAYQGKQVDAIRIMSPAELEIRQSKQRVRPVKAEQASTSTKADAELDDEIPF
jgi:hypothetical protein